MKKRSEDLTNIAGSQPYDGWSQVPDEALVMAQTRLSRDLLATAAAGLATAEVRYLVDSYYQIQDYRKAANSQALALAKDGEPHALITWLHTQQAMLENDIRRVMDRWTDSFRAGRWLKSQYGVGPVLSAGLLAHIDITRAPTVGHIWRFAGLDPTTVWRKGEKRPYNARLKVICWRAADSFVKFHNRPACFYGKLYEQRKAYELERDASGGCAEAAAAALATKHFQDRDTIAIYTSGHLPPGQLDNRARRWTAKLFLAHLHHVMYVCHYQVLPSKPYVISVLGHQDMIEPPGWPCD